MRYSRIGTTYIIMVWALLILMLGTVLTLGYQRNISDLRQLMADEAAQLIGVVTISARSSIHSLDEVEDLTAARLFDNARLIVRIASSHDLDREHLATIVAANNLHMVNILDQSGSSVMRVSTADREAYGDEDARHHEAVMRVLTGESTEEIIGFMESAYYAGQRYGVVVARPDGGAVVVNADSDQMLEFRRTIGLGTLFREIGGQAGVHYAVLQDTLGIVAASAGITTMDRIVGDPFLVRSLDGDTGTRFFDESGTNVFEIVAPLVVDEVNLGLVRIGMRIEPFEAIRSRAIRQFFVLFVAAVFSGAILLVYVMLRQNYRVLNREHDRILGEVRRMEEERRRSERLTSMGRLAAGVAHEIRNPLNSISIIAQRLRSEFTPVSDTDEYQRFLTVIGTEIGRITGIIENFLRYVRPPKLEIVPLPFAVLASNAIAVVGEQARAAGIELTVDAPDNLVCRCDPEQMKQVLMNLLLNAIDAAGADGTIGIAARYNGPEVVITVTDTGAGIPDEVLPNMFDPYFTTKDHGSGLGLSEVHRIISAHGGAIAAGNLPGGGAVFTIILPATGDRG